jgi:hypothetical protein
VSRVRAFVAGEIREALPAAVFFFVLFHMIALTKAVLLEDYSIGALRAAGATLGAVVVAKAILLVDALPIARPTSVVGVVRVAWKVALYAVVVLAFRIVEELIPLVAEHRSLTGGAAAMSREVSWPLFGVLALWIVGGLLLYCLACELVRAIGAARVKEILFGAR